MNEKYLYFKFGGTVMINFKLNKVTSGLLLLIFTLSLGVGVDARALHVVSDTSVVDSENFIFKEVDEFKDNSGDILVDRITNDKNVITGKTFKNSIIKFNINDVEYISNTDDEGNFIVLIEEGLLVDVDQVNVRVCDYLGNEMSNLSLVVHDILPPIDPKIDSVINNSDRVIRGFGEPNSSIKVLIGDKEFSGYTFRDGNFEIEVGDSLREVDNLRIVSYDYFNNYSNMIEKKVMDVIPPERPNIKNVDCVNNFVHGSGEANCEVLVSFDGKKYKSYINEEGEFYVQDDEGLLENTDHIKVQVVDLSGNTSEEVLFEVQKQNVGSISLKSLEPNNKIIRDAMIRLNGVDDYISNEDRVFNLNSDGNLLIDDIPFGDYELRIRYRTSDDKLEDNLVNISLNQENSEIEILID